VEVSPPHYSGTILTMNAVWIGVAVATVVSLAVAIKRLIARGEHPRADVDVGSVSEGWLSEQRSRKDS
jgi:hypothetical protein